MRHSLRFTASRFPVALRAIAITAAALAVLFRSALASAVGLTYVDASDLFNLTPSSAINASTSTGDDNLWGYRALGAGSSVFESNVAAEDAPPITQAVTGLTPNASYDLYVAFWSDDDENWGIQAGTSPGSLTFYNFTGPFGNLPSAGSQAALSAAGAVWDVLPPPNTTSQVFREGPTADPTDRLMLLGKAGTITADGSGNANVYIDDIAQSGPGRRSWLDGVAYAPAGTAVALSAALDSANGALTLTNPTSQPFQIKSYSITSAAGTLNAATWNPISGRLDAGGNQSFDTDIWNVTAPADRPSNTFTGLLSEAESPQNNGGVLAASGGSISFGNVYNKSRYQDVRLNLTLVDDTLVTIFPQYDGAPIAPGDFDLNGSLAAADFQLMMSNMHTNISALTQAAAHRRGDINGDRQINYQDFRLFRQAYEEAQGPGAFAGLLAQVPEPSSLGLLVLGALMVGRIPRKFALGAAVIALGVSLCSATSAQTLLMVDVDDRDGDAVAGPEGPNTVPGFHSFTMPIGTTGSQPSATAVLDGYSIGLTAVNAAGTPLATGGMDDRDRATPTTAPTLNQLYDDFIFTAGAVGVGGGIDLTISGGALQPDRQYSVSIYAFDTGSTPAPQPRTANWLDGNDNNAVVLSTSFNGGASPTTDEQYRFTGLARTDSSGRLLLRGRNSLATTDPGMFLNGFSVAVPVELTLEVNRTTGAIEIKNEQSTSFDVAYYELRSAAGSLNPTGWNSFDDANVGGADAWLEAGGSNANILSEGSLASMQTFAAGASLSLGSAFTAGGAQDVRFYYAAPGEAQLRSGLVTFVGADAVPGDFNSDGSVNGADLNQWKANFGTGAGGDADGDNDSDGADFLIWQRQFGAGAASAAVSTPEPTAAVLLALGGLLAIAKRRKI